MKKLFLLSIIIFSLKLYAAPGDTTWVYANNVKLNYYNNFDTAVAFPNGNVSYRKILMIFTLGEYTCPAGSQYCHQWDYTVTNYLLTKTDTLELSRFITPFANAGWPRFPSTWKQPYVYDVTDFYPLLKDSATVRILYSGYSGGFTANVKFAFIEGVPERNVYGIAPLWRGGFNYGDTSDPINKHIPARLLTAPSNTNSAELKFTVTGHGADSTSECCEFASNNYYVILDNTGIDTVSIWRDNCGQNELYPQGGTWVFDRGNWCPGDAVNTNTHVLTGITANSNYSVDVNFSPYSDAPHHDFGDYFLEGHVVYYGNINHTLDASLNDIISPNNFADHFRENPSGNSPIVKVRNTGSTTINSITFSYGVKDSVATQYTWTGTLASLKDTNLTLAPLNTLTHMSLSGFNGVSTFFVKIVSVNGTIDQDTTNNHLQSSFIVAPSWPNNFIVNLKTNNEGANGNLNQNPSGTTWTITDMNDNILYSELNTSYYTTYKDTITLPSKGFYKLTLTDAACDGLQWWANTQYWPGFKAGSFKITQYNGTTAINMNGYNYTGTWNNDFGCGFTQYFTTYTYTAGIHDITKSTPNIIAFPNPANDYLKILLSGIENINGQFEIVDAMGKVVLTHKVATAENKINITGLRNGIYTLIYRGADVSQVQTRIVIAK